MTYSESEDFAEKRKFVSDLAEMMAVSGIDASPWRCVEVGGEGGLLAGLIGKITRHVVSTDIIPAQLTYGGEFLVALKEKFDRNDESFPLDRVEFLTADAQNLPFREDWFDFFFSQNAFEHIPDPESALREAFRVTKPGGYIYIMFDPLWTADSGSHFLHYIGEPWLHLIADDEAIAKRMSDSGASPSEVSSYRNHMNRLPVSYYLEMFPRVIDELQGKVLHCHQWSGCVDLASILHPNRAVAAAKMKLHPDDLLVRGFRFFIKV